jgi:hypothetical protein
VRNATYGHITCPLRENFGTDREVAAGTPFGTGSESQSDIQGRHIKIEWEYRERRSNEYIGAGP